MESSTRLTESGSSNYYPLATENQRLRHKVFHLNSENVRLEELISEKEKALGIENEKLVRKQQENWNLRTEVSQCSYQVQELTQSNHEQNVVLINNNKLIDDLNRQLEFVKTMYCEKCNELESAKADATKDQNNFLKLRMQFVQKVDAFDNLKKTAEKTISEHATAISMERQQNCQLRMELEASTKKISQLKTVLQNVHGENFRLKNSIFKNLQTKKKLEETVAEKQRENEDLKATVSKFAEKVKSLEDETCESSDPRTHRRVDRCQRRKLNGASENSGTSLVSDQQPHPDYLNLQHVQDFSRGKEGIFCKCGVKFFAEQGLKAHIQRIGARSLTDNQGQDTGQEYEHFPGGESSI